MAEADSEVPGGAPGKTISLGVAETNALREKLGLKPLQETDDATGHVADEAKAVANLKEYKEVIAAGGAVSLLHGDKKESALGDGPHFVSIGALSIFWNMAYAVM